MGKWCGIPRERGERYMNRIVFAVLSMLLMSALLVNAASRPAAGTLKGTIVRTESDQGSLFFLRVKSNHKMYQFRLSDARIDDGNSSAMVAGKRVIIKYKNLQKSEMDDFYTADALTVKVLNKGKKKR